MTTNYHVIAFVYDFHDGVEHFFCFFLVVVSFWVFGEGKKNHSMNRFINHLPFAQPNNTHTAQITEKMKNKKHFFFLNVHKLKAKTNASVLFLFH